MKRLLTPMLLTVLGQHSVTHASDLKKPGYFGFTRGCVEIIETGASASPYCITSMTGSFALDVILSPFQTIARIADALQKPDDSKSTSTSSSSDKKPASGPEIPEEKKPILQKISLFMLAADDARAYLLNGTASSMLEAAVTVLRSQYPEFAANEDFTIESQSILDLESRLFESINKEPQ